MRSIATVSVPLDAAALTALRAVHSEPAYKKSAATVADPQGTRVRMAAVLRASDASCLDAWLLGRTHKRGRMMFHEA